MVLRMNVPIGTPAYAALRDQLRKDILSGVFPHGARLTIVQLVERYGVSQMPVREALQSLQGEGLVNILPHKGARVLSLDVRFVRNVFGIRCAIESLLARSSVHNLTNAAIARLDNAHGRFCVADREGDTEQVFTLNRAFHVLCYQYSDNDEAFRIYDHYNSLFGTLRRLYGFSPQRSEDLIKEHGTILDALRSRDEENAGRLVWSHCEGAREELLWHISGLGSGAGVVISATSGRDTVGSLLSTVDTVDLS